MRKFIFIFATLFVTTFANAQILKEWSGFIQSIGMGMQMISFNPIIRQNSIIGNYFVSERLIDNDKLYLDIIDASSMTTVKSVLIDDSGYHIAGLNVGHEERFIISKNIFSIDGKWACIVAFPSSHGYSDYSGDYYIYTEFEIRNEDGTILATIPYYYNELDSHNYGGDSEIKLVKAGNTLKLFVPKYSKYDDCDGCGGYYGEYDIYSLPGNGDMLDIQSISAPHNNARKFLHNNHVLIESNKNTYNMQGQQVR